MDVLDEKKKNSQYTITTNPGYILIRNLFLLCTISEVELFMLSYILLFMLLYILLFMLLFMLLCILLFILLFMLLHILLFILLFMLLYILLFILLFMPISKCCSPSLSFMYINAVYSSFADSLFDT